MAWHLAQHFIGGLALTSLEACNCFGERAKAFFNLTVVDFGHHYENDNESHGQVLFANT